MTLPIVRWFVRGQWTPGTVYSVDDVVNAPNSATYLVALCTRRAPRSIPAPTMGRGTIFYSLLLRGASRDHPGGRRQPERC